MKLLRAKCNLAWNHAKDPDGIDIPCWFPFGSIIIVLNQQITQHQNFVYIRTMILHEGSIQTVLLRDSYMRYFDGLD